MLCVCLCLGFWSVAGAFWSLFRVSWKIQNQVRRKNRAPGGVESPPKATIHRLTQSQWKTDKSREMHAVTYSLKNSNCASTTTTLLLFRLSIRHRSWARCLDDAVAACCLVRFSLVAWWELGFRSWIRVGVTLHAARRKTGRSFRKGAVGHFGALSSQLGIGKHQLDANSASSSSSKAACHSFSLSHARSLSSYWSSILEYTLFRLGRSDSDEADEDHLRTHTGDFHFVFGTFLSHNKDCDNSWWRFSRYAPFRTLRREFYLKAVNRYTSPISCALRATVNDKTGSL